MDIPKRDQRTREDIIEYMKKCAGQYVPEWRFDEENPDAGTALALLFADMMAENINLSNQSAARDMLSFLGKVNAGRLPARAAEGFVTFSVPEGMEGWQEISEGTRLLAEGEASVAFETQEEVTARPMGLSRIYLSSSGEDAIYQLYDGGQEETPSFFLFQGKGGNLQRHRIAFCFSRGLNIGRHAKAELSFQVTGEDSLEQEWEWAVQKELGIRFSYGTEQGFRHLECECENGKVRFELAGGAHGIAPREEFQSMYVIQAEITDAELFSQVCFSSAALSVRAQNIQPDFINVNGVDQEFDDFLVFGRCPAVYDEFYIVSREALGKAGARIQLQFDLDYVKIPLEYAEEKKMEWKAVMKKRDFIPEKEYDITVREVVWEYYNGYGWTRLPEGGAYQQIFDSEEEGRGHRVEMEFTCPSDIQKVLVNSSETYAIRARITRMDNAYKTRGAYIAPVAGRVSFSYDYSGAPLAPEKIIRWNNLEIQELSRQVMGREGFFTVFCDKDREEAAACYLGFTEPLAETPLKLLFVMQDSLDQAMPAVKWEYFGEGGWNPVHLKDGTEGFMHTGIVSCSCGGKPERKALFGQELFWIRLVDEEGAYQNAGGRGRYPKVEGIYPNSARIAGIGTEEGVYGLLPYARERNIKLPVSELLDIKVWVREYKDSGQGTPRPVWEPWKEAEGLSPRSGRNREFMADRQRGLLTFPQYMENVCLDGREEIQVRIRYQHCYGERGNLPAGRITRLNKPVGRISGCVNPIPTVGGLDGEKAPDAARRCANILRHGGRCVSARDYEDMAREAAGGICKVKCYSGFDRDGKQSPGFVTLVVLPGEYGGQSDVFGRVKMQIQEYLKGHMDETLLYSGRFSIVMPKRIRLCVKASIEISQGGDPFFMEKRLREELDRFLEPVHGNFHGEGWDIGYIPGQEQIRQALERVEGVTCVQKLVLRRFLDGLFEETEVGREHGQPCYALPEGGTYDLQIEQ